MSAKETIYKEWSVEKAWWFGAFLGDGCAPSSANKLTIVGDISTVTRWLNIVSTEETHKLYEYKHSLGTFIGGIRDKQLANWIYETYGYRGEKSSVIEWPYDMPKKFNIEFIRGLWDTDGHLSLLDRKKLGYRGNKSAVAAYRSKSIKIVEQLRAELHNYGLPLVKVQIKKYKVQDDSTEESYGIYYSGKSALKVAELLYKDSPEHLRNEKRYEAYLAIATEYSKRDEPCVCGKKAITDGKCLSCHRAPKRKTGPGTVCTTPDCEKPIFVKGLCAACRSRKRRALTK